MIPLTPLFAQYQDSFFLYTFRHLNKMRMIKSQHLVEIMATELTYLYNIACLIIYKDVQNEEIENLKTWALSLNDEFDLEHMKIAFAEKMKELNLRSFQPKSYDYKFSTIWDVIHFLALLIDDMVENRDKLTYSFVFNQLQQMKTFYYNLFSKLDCAVCRDHYIRIKGYLTLNIERLETCMNRERGGEPLEMVDDITSNNVTENVLMKHGTLYATMVFHNHINDYRYIQRNMLPPIKAFRMQWFEYKQMLGLTPEQNDTAN
ncbi:sox [Lambdina fiscellaria nucleopolyhedrovirus]|uniref:Sox n=1 Tax=Lambdina fiscellaria nucleopolyhedrovirus TaxID=1642929 RepID=A0A0E3URB2_9ABAC|nr:sox [Lambdina fiscellaria nucleopolyhedrovirus]AKC91685.1 sox [Lambdina fiscellaria nucleopolyhedrovirus]